MLLVGAKNLREITMFPMNQQAHGPADGRAVGGHAAAAARHCISGRSQPAKEAREPLLKPLQKLKKKPGNVRAFSFAAMRPGLFLVGADRNLQRLCQILRRPRHGAGHDHRERNRGVGLGGDLDVFGSSRYLVIASVACG